MPTTQDLGRAIRRLRKAQHLTTEALAFKARVSAGHLGTIERGHCNPRLETLFGLAEGLDVTFEELVRTTEAEAARHGERRLTPEEFEQHFGQLPTDGES